MALDAPPPTKVDRREAERVEEFESLARDAYDKPWWRYFVRLIEERRMGLLTTLVNATESQREEDRLRGRINELTWVMTLDNHASMLHKEKNDGR